MAERSRAEQPPAALRGSQYSLLLAGEAAWLYAWSIALGAWLGGGGWPLISLPLLVALLLAATVSTRLIIRKWPETRRMRIALALAGLVGAALAGFAAAALWKYAGRWAEAGDDLRDTEAGLRVFFAAGLALLVWWRGIAAGRDRLRMNHVEDAFRVGIFALAVILAVSALAGQAGAPAISALIPPIIVLVSAGLVGMPLARIVDQSERPRHAGGPSPAPSGPWLGMLLGIVAGVLLMTLLLARVFTFDVISAILEPLRGPLGAVFWALFYVIAVPLGFLVELLVYLFQLLVRPGGERPTSPQMPDTSWMDRLRNQESSNGVPAELLAAAKVLVALALGAVVVALLIRAIGRFRSSWSQDDVDEVRDVVWSWPGLRAIWDWLLAALRQRHSGIMATLFRPREDGHVGAFGGSIRELYRQFLALGEAIGQARRETETPHEYESRLNADEALPGSDEIRSVTESYVRARYGRPANGYPDPSPIAAALDRLRALWLDRLPSPSGREPKM